MPSSEDLAQAVDQILREATSRILMDEARAQYEVEDSNRFYDEDTLDQLAGLEEELIDTMNWAAMAVIKIRRKKALLEARGFIT